jgi:CRISPR-associated HD domain protein
MEISFSYETDSFSHPGERLGNHLARVTLNAKTALNRARLAFNIVDNTQFERAVLIAAALHDLGKASTEFQNYLNGKSYNEKLKTHAKISGVIALKVLAEVISNEDLNQITSDYLLMFTYISVKRHHGNLKNFEEELDLCGKAIEAENLSEQLTLLNRNDLELISELIEALIGIQTDLKYLVENINVFQLNDSTDITMSSVEFEDLDITSQLEYYLLGLSIISILLYSDKRRYPKRNGCTPEPLRKI